MPLKYQNHQGIIPFNKDNANPLKHSYSLENYESTSNIKESILIIPLAFRTLKLNNVAQEPDNRDSNTSFSKLTTVALPQPSKEEQKRNVNITFSESTTFGNPPIVWKINDNKSNYFTLYENIEKGNLKSYLKDTVQENLIKVALTKS